MPIKFSIKTFCTTNTARPEVGSDTEVYLEKVKSLLRNTAFIIAKVQWEGRRA